MNLSLLDPFTLTQEYPESLKYTLKSGHSTCIRFNWKGDLLASGRIDGVVVLFDMDTRSLARVLRGHVRQIQSLSWHPSGRYLLSASQDWKAVLWDLETGNRIRSVRFDSPIYIAEICPVNHLVFVASLYEDCPYLVDMTGGDEKGRGGKGSRVVKMPLPTAPLRPLSGDAEEGEIDEKRQAQDAKQLTTATVWTSNGRYIIAGTNKGWINIISAEDTEEFSEDENDGSVGMGDKPADDDVEEGEELEPPKKKTRIRKKGEVLGSTRLTNGCITYIRLTTSGRDMVVNANDRILRTLQVPPVLYTDHDTAPSTPPPAHIPSQHRPPRRKRLPLPTPDDLHLEVEHKFQDVVNRLLWNHTCFSSTGEYMTASTYKNHDIYIWERTIGSLVKILEGPKEELGVVEWHPNKPVVAAVGLETGEIFVWANEIGQVWSALAPDFEEVEENVEYIEREDEFDIHPREEVKRRRMQVEDEVVDVFGLDEGSGGGVGLGGRGREEDDDVGRGRGGGSGETMGGGGYAGAEEWRMPVVMGLEDTESDGSDSSPRRRTPPVVQDGGGGKKTTTAAAKKRRVEA